MVTGQTNLFIQHLIALAIVLPFAFGGSYLLFKLTAIITPLRVAEDEELEGLDISQHDETIILELVTE